MSKVFIEESTLTAIGDAIREKTSKTDLIPPLDMPTEIKGIVTGDLGIPEEALVISGICSYRFSNNGWNWFIEKYGNQITTKDISVGMNMFQGSTALTKIPFALNFVKGTTSSGGASVQSMFSSCYTLEEVPPINNLKPNSINSFFDNCYVLEEIPDDIDESWDWSSIDNATSSYSSSRDRTFQNCYSLRSVPMSFLNHGNPVAYSSYSIYSYSFSYCYALDELVGIPFPHKNVAWTSNAFNSFVDYCGRLKELTFALQEDGTPYTVNWKSQTINLSSYVGWEHSPSRMMQYSRSITSEHEVTDDASYQALKDSPDWWSMYTKYSRYNHDSAVNTINSLPDTSAYLASAGGTNTIKFEGDAGSATDGGAINTLTAEEIAVATAKGWTVTLV